MIVRLCALLRARLPRPLQPARVRPRLAAAALGLTAGAAVGLVAVTASTALDAPPPSASLTSAGVIDATHTPPTLVASGEPVTLRYDIACAPPSELDSSGCVGSGTVFLRAGRSGPFRPLALALDEDAPQGRYRVAVPPEIASSPSGFSYYAVLRDESNGASMTLPAGGASAPERALPLRSLVEISLDPVDFDSVATPDAEVARATWGDGPANVGLEGGRQAPMGASSFAVSPSGEAYLLDEAHRRILRWSAGSGSPTAIPLKISPTQADLALSDGSLFVLESPHAGSPRPVLRGFDRQGKPLGEVELEERTAAAIDTADGSVFALAYPGGQWAPAFSGTGSALPTTVTAEASRRAARQGRPGRNGHDVFVLRNGRETRLALVAGDAVLRSWRLTSSVDLGEIQLAKPFRNGILVVAHPYTDDRDEFLVLVLDPKGVARRFGVASNSWAETAPLGRFRLVGTSLYQLGSDEQGAFVNRFDLGGIS